MQGRKSWDEVARSARKPLLAGRIAAVVHASPDSPEDPDRQLYAWFQHLNKVLACPFDARVCRGADDFKDGDRVQVLALVGHGDIEGMIVKYKRGGRRGEMALSRLGAVGRRSESASWLDAYRLWRDSVIDTGSGMIPGEDEVIRISLRARTGPVFYQKHQPRGDEWLPHTG